MVTIVTRVMMQVVSVIMVVVVVVMGSFFHFVQVVVCERAGDALHGRECVVMKRFVLKRLVVDCGRVDIFRVQTSHVLGNRFGKVIASSSSSAFCFIYQQYT